MTLLMIQIMSQGSGQSAVSMNQIIPFLIAMKDEKDDKNTMLTLVLMSAAMGGLQDSTGFNSNFNMLLPFALIDCESWVEQNFHILIINSQAGGWALWISLSLILPFFDTFRRVLPRMAFVLSRRKFHSRQEIFF